MNFQDKILKFWFRGPVIKERPVLRSWDLPVSVSEGQGTFSGRKIYLEIGGAQFETWVIKIGFSTLWISGGYNFRSPFQPNPLSSLIGINDMKITLGPRLPIPLAGHCIINIDHEKVFLFGGVKMTILGKGAFSHNVYIYTQRGDYWTLVKLIVRLAWPWWEVDQL